MENILAIVGLGHTGSTILDLSLGCNSKVIGLGEIVAMLKATHAELESTELSAYLCSCGKNYNECEFWSKAKELLIQYYDCCNTIKYQLLIHKFQEMFGSNIWIVDSSKSLHKGLLSNCKKEKCNLKVVFLVRDFRSWIYSRHSRLGTSRIVLALTWLKNNLNYLHELEENNIDYMNIGYDEFALYPEMILRKLCGYIDVNYEPCMLEPHVYSNSHILRGNVVRADQEKASRITYDGRWLTSSKIAVLSSLLFPLHRINNKLVYSNFVRGHSTAFGRKQRDFYLFGNARKEEIRKSVEGR